MTTTVTVRSDHGDVVVCRDGDKVAVGVFSTTVTMTPAEAVELSNALAFVAGKAMRARKVNQTEVK